MSQTMQERNKALVLEAFDTLFNKRDYEAAERFWSPNYIQHSAHIAPGREGLFNLIKSMPPTLEYEPGMIVADGDLVIVHGRFSGFGAARELGRGRHPPDRGRGPRRALGRHPGRGDSRAIQERPADVRRLVSAVPVTGPITQKELTKRLRELERSGLVHRRCTPRCRRGWSTA